MPETPSSRPGRVRPTTPEDPTVANDANPTGQQDVSTGQVGAPEVIDAQEHVLGDDPRRVAHKSGYHDSLTGRPVDAEGNFADNSAPGEGPIPKHRIVADDWPTRQERIDDPAKREGNEAK